MKPIRLITPAIALSFLLIYLGCQKLGNPGPGVKPVVVEFVTATVSGRVIDNDQVPVQGASVKAGAVSGTTDVNGDFTLSNVSLDKNAGFVKVEKDGFFQGSRTILVNAGTTNYVHIQLIKKTIVGTISGNAGGSVTVPTGGTIVFPASGFIDAGTKATYSGMVNVSAFFINPASSNVRSIMPGDLRGIDQNNEEKVLQSFGINCNWLLPKPPPLPFPSQQNCSHRHKPLFPCGASTKKPVYGNRKEQLPKREVTM
jgi:Carboxypeptidase regulatory-like domain